MKGADGPVPRRRRRRRLDPDSWAWRHRLRQDSRTRGPYRLVVGVLGGCLIVLALVTGWLPGPGGIPLALVGLAVLATEFHWASRLLHRAEGHFDQFVAWSSRLPAWARWLGVAGLVVTVLAAVWAALVLFGVPIWAPTWMRSTAVLFPGR